MSSGSEAFDASYFDGSSTRQHVVKACLLPEGLRIVFNDEITGEPRDILWEYTGIHPNEVNHHKVILKYGVFPQQTLELSSMEFLDRAKEVAPPGSDFLKVPYHQYFRIGTKAVATGVLCVIGFLLLTYFFIIPAVMNLAAERFPLSLERDMGQKMKASWLSGQQIDSSRTVYVNKFFNSLHKDTHYKVNITVVKSKVKNAFALPGGEIVVFSGILDNMKDYDELAALLGHELGHVEKRHTLKMLFKNLANYIIISAVLQDVSGIMAVVVDNAATLNQLSYNRKVEAESDRYGFELMKENRIDLKGMPNLFTRLKDDSSIASQVPEFLMTHPSLDRRIRDVNTWIAESHAIPEKNDTLEAYWKHIGSSY